MNTITTQNPFARWTAGALALAVFTAVSFAKEDSGKVLQGLVDNVNTKLTKLEQRVQQQNKTQASLQSELAKSALAYKQAATDLDKLDAKTDCIGKLAEMNKNDRQTVSETIDTIVSVVTDLNKLDKALVSGPFNPEAIQQQRVRMRAVLTNVAPILQHATNCDLAGKPPHPTKIGCICLALFSGAGAGLAGLSDFRPTGC